MTCPCGKPASGFAYWRPRQSDRPPIYCCSMKCLNRLTELRGEVPERTGT